ncbi:hypothetical protein AX769_02925 [Frondihabitans sp. PAMC 28766]|nr:hypothetical protein AX769_02925 [Frondihabitans sp. PAMC 28766]
MREVGLGALLVVLDGADVTAVGHPDHDGHRLPALVPVLQLGQLRRDLVEAGEDEAVELDLADGPEAVHGQADRGADDARLGQGRVDHAAATELGLQPLGDAEDAPERADVLAHEQHSRVVEHRLAQARVDRATERQDLSAGRFRLDQGCLDDVGHACPPNEAS